MPITQENMDAVMERIEIALQSDDQIVDVTTRDGRTFGHNELKAMDAREVVKIMNDALDFNVSIALDEPIARPAVLIDVTPLGDRNRRLKIVGDDPVEVDEDAQRW